MVKCVCVKCGVVFLMRDRKGRFTTTQPNSITYCSRMCYYGLCKEKGVDPAPWL